VLTAELAAGRYNNAANRAYYACFHAAIVALLRAGYERATWSHADVQALFSGQLIGRRRQQPASLRDVLSTVAEVRLMGDYDLRMVSGRLCRRAVQSARRFVATVLTGQHES